MALSRLLSDRVTLVKSDGQRFESIRASVQPGKIFTQDPSIPIEEGDRFERTLPSGITEAFIVTDAGFYQGIGGIPSHYQSSVRKITAASSSATSGRSPRSQVFNLTGPNPRVNIDSSDASTNVVIGDYATLFSNLRDAVTSSSLDEGTVRSIVQQVDAMESAVGTKTFTERYKEFIEVAADHMTLIGPFLPALTNLLAG